MMDKDKVKLFAKKVFVDMAGAMTAGMAYLGVKTGLFRAMASVGPMTLDEVVNRTGLQRRYIEEWLHGMTAARYLAYDPAARTFTLPEEHAYLLASDDTDHFMGGLFAVAPAMLRVAPAVAEAFRKGGGVPFEECGPDCVIGLDLVNRGTYAHRFTGYWLASMPPVVSALSDGGRVLDVGCGAGRVCIAIAKDFPHAEIVGLDPDAESIRQADAAAEEADLAGRIRFIRGTTGTMERGRGFDLITACDCLHDFAAPHETLSEIRALLKPEGTLFIVEPKAADALEDNINPIATMFYGFSLFHCMTQSLARGGPGLGTCLGPARTEALLREAGFRHVERLEIKSPVNLFYAARP